MKQNLDTVSQTVFNSFPITPECRVTTGSLICHYIRESLICHTRLILQTRIEGNKSCTRVWFGVRQCSQEPRRVTLSMVRASYSRVLHIAVVVGLLRLFTKNCN